MKSRMIILIISIIIAITVLIVGVLGLSDSKDKNKNNSAGNLTNDLEQPESQDKESGDDSNVDDKTEESSAEAESEITTPSETHEDIPANAPVANLPVNVSVDTSKPMVALTFDDGPSRNNTLKILDALKQHNARATFFMVGYNIQGNEDIIKQISEQGSEAANHTANHGNLSEMDENGIHAEVDSIADTIKSVTGQSTVLLRPPYGATGDTAMVTIKDPIILWSIDTEDWKTRNVQSTVSHVQSHVYDGSIILMHDIYPETADAAVQIIEWLDSQGYQMVTVSELGYYRRGGLQPGIRYGSLQP